MIGGTVFGNNGNDTLQGGAGDDVLEGGANTDVLFADPGDDTLLGGSGTDSADYSTVTGSLPSLTATLDGLANDVLRFI